MKELNKNQQDIKLTEQFDKLTNKILLLFNVYSSVCNCGSDKLHIDIKNKKASS